MKEGTMIRQFGLRALILALGLLAQSVCTAEACAAPGQLAAKPTPCTDYLC